ncbi:methyl-accepting chemotaxis sensory transducer [Magnetococcus marinus MC-1]|uniref:Methyl-accepting chemotaxis sensory transducer n=1 Tax=Magnetococcus marinus (strain ATCC BAA-1437 / JCM 17883 / MC-1) TaxID=156889 RepID=A0L8W9_MAGMM|nr:methyl-accepting chemotaxis protein [Magnetococcus marinus]ABK44412.1 methyl-accepting chemotaxis sensory transducer [Magnetococcus marinus MC-1]
MSILEMHKQWKIGWLMGLAFGISLGVLLVVIGHNYTAIGIVQKLNTRLQGGPLALKSEWHDVALTMSNAETVRLRFLLTRNQETADSMEPLISRIQQIAATFSGTLSETLVRRLLEYRETFVRMVEAQQNGQQAQQKLTTDREEIERLIYELENPGLEEALGEFQLAELSFFNGRTADQEKSVRVYLDRFLRDSAGHAVAGDLAKAVNTYRTTFDVIVATNAVINETSTAMQEQARTVTDTVRKGVQEAAQQAKNASHEAQQRAMGAQSNALMWAALGVLVAAIFITLFQRSFQHQVSIALDGLARLSSGDLRHRFAVSSNARNEMCRIMSSTNLMADKLSHLLALIIKEVIEINEVTGRFSSLRGDLHTCANRGRTMIKQVVSTISEVDEKTRSVQQLVLKNEQQAVSSEESAHAFQEIIEVLAQASEHASDNVSSMASAANEMPQSVAEVNSNLKRVGEAVERVAAAINDLDASQAAVRGKCRTASAESDKASKKVESANREMDRLEVAAGEIGNVVKMIKNIAEQTNMLALNASIEAAGAGEAGKGFAVVANEVKELAKQTADATKMIGQKVDDVQSIANGVVKIMDEVVGAIQSVVNANSEITETMDQQVSSTGEITQSMGHVTEATRAVTDNASRLQGTAALVAKSAEQAVDGANEIVRVSRDAVEQADRIADNASHMLAQSREMKVQTESFSASSDEVRGLGEKMDRAMLELQGMSNDVEKLTGTLQQGANILKEATGHFEFT